MIVICNYLNIMWAIMHLHLVKHFSSEMLLNHYSMYDVIECNIVSLTTKFTLYCYNRVTPPIVFMNFCLVLRMPMRKTPPDQRTLESVGPISNKPCLAERPYQTPVTDLTLTLTRVCLTMWLKWMNDLSLTERMCASRLFLNCSWGGSLMLLSTMTTFCLLTYDHN